MAVAGGLVGAAAVRLFPLLSSAHNQMVHSHTLTVCHIFPPAMSLLISVWNCCRWLPQMNARALGELKQIKSLAGPPNVLLPAPGGEKESVITLDRLEALQLLT